MPDANSVYTLLKEVFLIVEDGDKRFFHQHNLTITHFYTLWHLRNQSGLTLRALSDRMLCDKSNITRVVKTLEQEALVYREDHESDGRAFRIYLSDLGLKRLNAVDAQHIAFNEGRFSDRVDFAALETSLNQLKTSLVEALNTPIETPTASNK